MRAWQKILLLLLLAVGLPSVFFQNRAEPAHCQADVCKAAPGSIGITNSGVAIITSTGKVVDALHVPLRTSFRPAYEGLYPRGGVPYAIAYLFGLALPIWLLWKALSLAFRRRGLTDKQGAPNS